MKNLNEEKKGFGFIIMGLLLTLLVLITCTCSGPKLMLGTQSFGNLIGYSTYSGKLVRLTIDVLECATSKIDGLDLALCRHQKLLTKAQSLQIQGTVYYQSLEQMRKKCLQTKLFQYQPTIHSSLNLYKMGWTNQKQNLPIEFQHQNLQKRSIQDTETEEDLSGLDTTIDWKNTGDNSYDGEKLQLLVHDESGKWEKPDNILNNWRVTKTCLRLGRRIIGKCMMGSTSNALNKGGGNFKRLYNDSNVLERNSNGQTKSGLYSLFIPMEWNMEGFMDMHGHPVFNTPEYAVPGIDGLDVTQGVLNYWNNEVDSLRNDSDALNEFYRQFPRTEAHAFRDEAKNSLFNLTKFYEQIDFNDGLQEVGLFREVVLVGLME